MSSVLAEVDFRGCDAIECLMGPGVHVVEELETHVFVALAADEKWSGVTSATSFLQCLPETLDNRDGVFDVAWR